MAAESEVRAGYEWLSQFVTQEGWSERGRKIQSLMLEVAHPHDSAIGSEEFRSLAADRFNCLAPVRNAPSEIFKTGLPPEASGATFRLCLF